jgi:hypothetical protein
MSAEFALRTYRSRCSCTCANCRMVWCAVLCCRSVCLHQGVPPTRPCPERSARSGAWLGSPCSQEQQAAVHQHSWQWQQTGLGSSLPSPAQTTSLQRKFWSQRHVPAHALTCRHMHGYMQPLNHGNHTANRLVGCVAWPCVLAQCHVPAHVPTCTTHTSDDTAEALAGLVASACECLP